MSTTIDCVYRDFKKNGKIKGALIYKFGSINEFKISIQCDAENINVDSEVQRLHFLCEKYEMRYTSCPWHIKFSVIRTISVIPQDSTFLFIFTKKMILLFLVEYL